MFISGVVICVGIGCTVDQKSLTGEVTVRLCVAGNEPFTRLIAVFPNQRTVKMGCQSSSFPCLWQLQEQTIRILKSRFIQSNHYQRVLIGELEIVSFANPRQTKLGNKCPSSFVPVVLSRGFAESVWTNTGGNRECR